MKIIDLALKVGAKRLHQDRQYQIKTTQSYRKKFFFKGNLKSFLLEKRINCPACTSTKNFYLFIKNGGKYSLCSNCDLIYLNPVFKDKYLKTYYSRMTDGQSFVSKKEKIYYNNIYNKGLSKILKFSNKLRTILDIGCSSGIFLDLAKKKNLITYGVELNKKELKLVSSKHVIFSKNIFEFYYDRKFDCITMWDVIEHIKDTNLLLKRIYNMLSPNGIFFFQTPNAFSAASTILNKNCNMFDGIEHVNLFSLKNIHLIAKKNNFKILSIETIISEIPIINNYLEFKDIYLGDSRKSKLFQIIDEKKLHKNLLGYKFQVVFKKS